MMKCKNMTIYCFCNATKKMPSKEKVGDVGAPETASQISTTSTPKHCRICQVAVKNYVGPMGKKNVLFLALGRDDIESGEL